MLDLRKISATFFYHLIDVVGKLHGIGPRVVFLDHFFFHSLNELIDVYKAEDFVCLTPFLCV